MNKRQMDKFLGDESYTIVKAMEKIDSNAKGILFIVGQDNRLKGTVTDGDIRRALIRAGNLGMRMTDVMNRNPRTVMAGEEKNAERVIELYQVCAVGVTDTTGKLMDIILRNEDIAGQLQGTGLHEVPVVIMAGGKGTRLYPYTRILPKPLIPIGNIPIVERILDRFCRFGANEFYITVSYRKNMIKSYLSEQQKYNIEFLEEKTPLGTAGGLRLLPKGMSQPFLLTNCDILIAADYEEIYRYHCEEGNMVTVVSALKNIEVPYGVVKLGENGNITALEEKPHLSYLVNTGMYVINPECIQWIPDDQIFHMTDLLDQLLESRQKVGMYPVSEESFLDMGEWEELQRMEQKLKQYPD